MHRRMSCLIVFAALLSLSTLAVGACAQDVAVARPDPVRLDLARKLVELSGGEAQAKAQIKTMIGAVEKNASTLAPSAPKEFMKSFYDVMEQDFAAMTPQILDMMVRAYAANFTEQELRDLIAFQSSESGQSMVRKLPQVRLEVMSELMPLMSAALPDMMERAFDKICARSPCTAEQRAAMAKTTASLRPQPPPVAR